MQFCMGVKLGSLIRGVEHRNHKVLVGVFGLIRRGVIGGSRKLHKEDLST
jgi:hypothetical protein